MKGNHEMHVLGAKLGLIFALTLVTLSIANMTLGIGAPIIVLLASFYKGYAATLLGTLMGLLWGFIHGYVVGVFVFLAKKYTKI